MTGETTEGIVRRAARSWVGFWFTPADPTPLCLMRIVAGLLTLYVHIAYSFDLVPFFGPDGWCDQKLCNDLRKTMPHVGPRMDWSLPTYQFAMPADNRQRDVLRAFIVRLIESPGTERHLEFMRTVGGLDVPPDERDELLRYLRDKADPAERDTLLEAYVNDRLTPEERELLPRYFFHPPASVTRRPFVEALSGFQALLPENPDDRRRLISLLTETNAVDWRALQEFVIALRAKSPQDRIDYLDFLSLWGVPPEMTHARGLNTYSPWFHVTDPRLLWAIHCAHLFVITLFMLGMYTRVTSVLTWLAGLAYINRAQPYLFGQDTMMNLSLFYLMMSPCGAKWSLDRWMARKAALARGVVLPPVAPSVSAGFVLRLFQIQYCFMYLSAGLSKLKGTAWWNGTALFGCMANAEFSPMHIKAYRDLVRWLCQHRVAWELVNTSVAALTLATEISFPFLAWTRLRPVVVSAALMMHTGIAVLMGLSVFSLFMFSMLLCWIPPDAINWMFESDARSG
jgi:hypothetical protein